MWQCAQLMSKYARARHPRHTLLRRPQRALCYDRRPKGSQGRAVLPSDSVEFLPEQMNFEQCEQWHANVKALAPTSEHRLRHIYKEANGEVSGIFCSSPDDCVMMQVRTDTGVALPGYVHPLDYPWD